MRRNRGFTLIEVLLALMIFGLTAVVMGAAYLNVLNSYEAAQHSNLDDDEVAEGYILTCQGIPDTDSITVRYE